MSVLIILDQVFLEHSLLFPFVQSRVILLNNTTLLNNTSRLPLKGHKLCICCDFLSSISFIFSLIQSVISNLFCLFFLIPVLFFTDVSNVYSPLHLFQQACISLVTFFFSSAFFLSSRSSCFISFCGVPIIFPQLSIVVVSLFIVLLNSISPQPFIQS